MVINTVEFIYLGIWSIIGSILGFFAFTYNPHRAVLFNILRCCLSIGIGIFIAFPIYTYLDNNHMFSKPMCIMLGGLSSFGLPDFVVKWWPKIIRAVTSNMVDRLTCGNPQCLKRLDDIDKIKKQE